MDAAVKCGERRQQCPTAALLRCLRRSTSGTASAQRGEGGSSEDAECPTSATWRL